MKPRPRPIKDLYFRFIGDSGLRMDSQELAVILAQNALIELIPHNTEPRIEHYRDLKKLEGMDISNLLRALGDKHGQ